MQDVELMNMRYALEYAVLALGAMEKSMTDESGNQHHMAICYMKDLRKHLEAINSIPRKVTFCFAHFDYGELQFFPVSFNCSVQRYQFANVTS